MITSWVLDKARLRVEDDPQEIFTRNQNSTIQPNRIYTARISCVEWTEKILPNFQVQTDHLNPARRPDMELSNQIKKKLASEILSFQRLKNENKRKLKD